MAWSSIKRRTFISHFKGDRVEVYNIFNYFANRLQIFSPYILGANNNDDFINNE